MLPETSYSDGPRRDVQDRFLEKLKYQADRLAKLTKSAIQTRDQGGLIARNRERQATCAHVSCRIFLTSTSWR